MTKQLFAFLAFLLTAAAPLLAQADQESPYQVNGPSEQESEGSGIIWIALALVVLGGVFILLRKKGDRGTANRQHKY